MAKRLFLLLFLSLIGVINTPNFLTADDSFIIRQPEFHAVNTVEIERPVAKTNGVQTVTTANTQVVPVVSVAPANSIAIAGRNLAVVNVANTAVDSGNHVNKYGDRFLYGHNTSVVFGGLVNLGVGSSFTLTLDGLSTNYQVKRVVIFEKNTTNGRLQMNGEGSYMKSVANANFDGAQYNIALMTCYGISYGNGDASHRLVLFADAI
ncbi:hypothetical protein IJJ05_00650 [Candidatus Saccharibacteria bacterium]|nr:hypothetical protein [Candidatus Saccharibacteria bacterium]